MILAVDVGNTNITCGVFKGDEIVASFRITTKMPRTSDEYGMILGTLLEKNQVEESAIKDAIIASVVPNVMHSLQNAIIKYLGITPIIVEAGIKTGIRVATPNPQQIGADRIVDAVAAYELYGGPVLVIDFGTAKDDGSGDAKFPEGKGKGKAVRFSGSQINEKQVIGHGIAAKDSAVSIRIRIKNTGVSLAAVRFTAQKPFKLFSVGTL